MAVSIEAKDIYQQHLFCATTAPSAQCSPFGKKQGKARETMVTAKHTHIHLFPNRPSSHAAVR